MADEFAEQLPINLVVGIAGVGLQGEVAPHENGRSVRGEGERADASVRLRIGGEGIALTDREEIGLGLFKGDAFDLGEGSRELTFFDKFEVQEVEGEFEGLIQDILLRVVGAAEGHDAVPVVGERDGPVCGTFADELMGQGPRVRTTGLVRVGVPETDLVAIPARGNDEVLFRVPCHEAHPVGVSEKPDGAGTRLEIVDGRRSLVDGVGAREKSFPVR